MANSASSVGTRFKQLPLPSNRLFNSCGQNQFIIDLKVVLLRQSSQESFQCPSNRHWGSKSLVKRTGRRWKRFGKFPPRWSGGRKSFPPDGSGSKEWKVGIGSGRRGIDPGGSGRRMCPQRRRRIPPIGSHFRTSPK